MTHSQSFASFRHSDRMIVELEAILDAETQALTERRFAAAMALFEDKTTRLQHLASCIAGFSENKPLPEQIARLSAGLTRLHKAAQRNYAVIDQSRRGLERTLHLIVENHGIAAESNLKTYQSTGRLGTASGRNATKSHPCSLAVDARF